MDMNLVFTNTETEETDNKRIEALKKAIESVNNAEPTFVDKLNLWLEEYCTDFTYQYSGRRYETSKGLITDRDYEMDYKFKCEMPLEIKLYFKGLIEDIRNQIKESYIALYDYYDFYEDEDDAERLGYSTLPDSVKDFIQATDASYGFIIKLVALASGEDTYKFVISDNCFYDNRTFSDLVVTSNALMVTKKMVKAAEEAKYALEEMLDNYDEGDEDYERIKNFKWYDICCFEGNEKAHKVYIEYVIKESGRDVDYYKNRLVDKFIDEVINNTDKTKQGILRTISWKCWRERDLFKDIQGYVYLKYNTLLARLDDESAEVAESINKLAEDLLEDILLRIVINSK